MSSYGLKEHQQHREVASANTGDIASKWMKQKELNTCYKPEDQFNGDKSYVNPSIHPTEGWWHTRSAGRRISFESPYPLLAIPWVLRSYLHSLSGSLQSPVASRRRQGRRSISITRTTRKCGWLLSYSKSEWIPVSMLETHLLYITGGLRCLMTWCERKTGKFAYILTTFWATIFPTSWQMLSSSSSNQTLWLGSSHSMLGLFTASKLITNNGSAKKHSNRMLVAKQIFIHSTYLRPCIWPMMLGTTWHLKQSKTAGTMPISNVIPSFFVFR